MPADFQIKIERLDGIDVNELCREAITLERVHDGTLHDCVNIPGISPAGEEADDDGDDGIDDALAQFLEMFEEAHGGHLLLPADSFTGEEAAASGIGRTSGFNSEREQARETGQALGAASTSGIFGSRVFRSFELFGGRGIEDAVGQRSERGLKWRQDLLPGAACWLATAIQGIHFGLDLRAEFVGSAPELVEEARDLAADLRHFLGAEKDQHQKKQEDHLAGEAKIHTLS